MNVFGVFFQILASDKTGDFGVKLYLPKNTYNGIVELSAKKYTLTWFFKTNLISKVLCSDFVYLPKTTYNGAVKLSAVEQLSCWALV